MKKLLISLVLSVSVILMSAQSNMFYRITASATVTVAAGALASSVYVYSSGAVVLAGNYTIANASTPPAGTRWRVYFNVSSVTVGANTISIFGQTLTNNQIAKGGYFDFTVSRDHTGTNLINVSGSPNSFLTANVIPVASLDTLGRGRILVGKPGVSLNYVSSIYAGTSGSILIGDGTDLVSVAQTGDVIYSTAGVSAIQAGVIVNADVAAGAAIARSKTAVGTADHVVINDGAGVFSSEAALNTLRGGLGIDASGSTGFVKFSAGTATISTIIDSKTFNISFDSSAVADFRSDNKIKMPCAGTVTGIYAYATTAFSATDAGTIIAKNNAGTTITSGTVTFAASDPRGTAYSITPSANNTFVANDILSFTNTKHTPGGNALITVTYTRTP